MSKLITQTLESIRSFLDTLNTVEKDWDSVYEEIGRCDQEISDLLHEIELTEFDHVEGYQLSEEIQKVRRRRRELKNYQEIIRHLKEFLDRNKSLKISLFKVMTSMERTRDYQMYRKYTPRVRTDLKLCLEENQTMHHEFEDEELIDETETYNDLDLDLTDVYEEEVYEETEEPEVVEEDVSLPFCSSNEEETEEKEKQEKTSETA